MTRNPAKRPCTWGDCKAWAIRGGTVCVKHGGMRPDVKANALIRAEVLAWRLGDAVDDPGDTLLRLITQSRMRADAYSDELEKLASESEDMRDALIGESWVSTDETTYKAGEYIRGLAQIEAQERDRLAGFCTKAIAAGLAERVVRLAEKQAAMAQAALLAGLDAAGINGEQRRAVLAGAAKHLRSVAS